MQNYPAGEELEILVPLKIGDEYFLPLVGTVTYTVRDNSGVPLANHTNINVVTDDSTSYVKVLLSISETDISTNSIEKRSISVKFLSDEGSQIIEKIITLTNYQNHSVTFETVRAILGVNSLELPDRDIDIVSAYLRVEDRVTKSVLDTSLTSGGVLSLLANEAIALRVCIGVLDTFEVRISQRIGNGDFIDDRFKSLDFISLRKRIIDNYTSKIRELTGEVLPTIEIFSVAPFSDPITGV